jgi:hypothetical protein
MRKPSLPSKQTSPVRRWLHNTFIIGSRTILLTALGPVLGGFLLLVLTTIFGYPPVPIASISSPEEGQ